MIKGLRSLFRVLTARQLLPTDPTQQITTGSDGSIIPLPLEVEPIRQALESADPARALLCALTAFHGLHVHHLRHLKLTDLNDGRLATDDRAIVLAAPVRERLTAYLQHRTDRWPTTSNPHLFVHARTAVTTTCVGPGWARQHLGPHLTPRKLRSDRILNEALATGNDAKHLSEMFGISLRAARRYTTVLGHPGLSDPDLHMPTP